MEKVLYQSVNNREAYSLCMAYPACEAFALSSLGYMWLYKIADESEGVNVCRLTTDSETLKCQNLGTIAFSMSFDFDFMGVFEILEKLSIPFLASEKESGLIK